MLSRQKGAFVGVELAGSGGGVRFLFLDVPVGLLWMFRTQVNRNAAQSGFAED